MSIGTTYVLDGVKVTIRPRDHRLSTREMSAKNRVYIWNLETADQELNEMEKALPEPLDKGVDKENDRAYNRYNRLYAKKSVEAAKKFIERLIAEGHIKFAYANAEDVKYKFSRTAGCSCPCSPGVIVDSLMRQVDSYAKFDVYITF